jgi:hypothetical protein
MANPRTQPAPEPMHFCVRADGGTDQEISLQNQ